MAYVDTFDVLGVTLKAEEEVAKDIGFQIQGMMIDNAISNMKEDIAKGKNLEMAKEALESLISDFERGAKEGYFEKESCKAINAELYNVLGTIA